jgi:hypothetical protein
MKSTVFFIFIVGSFMSGFSEAENLQFSNEIQVPKSSFGRARIYASIESPFVKSWHSEQGLCWIAVDRQYSRKVLPANTPLAVSPESKVNQVKAKQIVYSFTAESSFWDSVFDGVASDVKLSCTFDGTQVGNSEAEIHTAVSTITRREIQIVQ